MLKFSNMEENSRKNKNQDGRLAPAYFSPNYKDFDQFLHTVKHKTTVLILVFNEFLKINSTTDFCTLCKGYHDFPSKTFRLTVPKNFVEEPFCVAENFWYRKNLCILEGITFFRQNFLVSQCRKIFRATLLCFTKFLLSKKLMDKRGGGSITIFCQNFFVSAQKIFVGEPVTVSLISGIENCQE